MLKQAKHCVWGLLILQLAFLVAVLPMKATAAPMKKGGFGSPEVMLEEGVKLLQSTHREDQEKALTYLNEVARLEKVELKARALLWLGRAYRDGLAGTPKDTRRAFGYFEQAAGREGRNGEARFELGRAYMNGEGTDRNLIAAYMWTDLSLHEISGLNSQARAQKARLEKMLSEAQLEKARVLVKQIETLYLH